LSGGGARGSAHIGVLKVFERERLPIDCIAGTSFGALVGGLFAVGYPADAIGRIVADQDWIGIFSDAPLRRLTPLVERRDARYQAQVSFRGWTPELPSGLLEGQRLTETLDVLTAGQMLRARFDFDRLPVRFRAVAANLIDGKAYIFRDGSMATALRASMAIPLLFTPLEKDGMLLVDGGLADNLPAAVARAMGADIVIAVDAASPLLRKDEIRSFINVMDQSLSLRMKQNEDESLKLADIVLKPDLEPFAFNDYDKSEAISVRGEEEATRKLEQLKVLLSGAAPRFKPEFQEKAPRGEEPPVIDSIEFRGLENVPRAQIKKNLQAKPGRVAAPPVISGDVRRLYATRLFDSVYYSLEPLGGNRYRLAYIVKEASKNTLGVGLRYDSDYKFVALAEFNARQLFHTPSKATFSNQFGGLNYHSAALRLISPSAPFLYFEPRLDLRRLERLDIRDKELKDRFTDRREGGQIVIGASVLRQLEVEGGYRIERVRVSGGSQPNVLAGTDVLAGLTFRVLRDSLDFPEFPGSGTLLRFQADKQSKQLGGDFDYSKWQADYRRFFRLSDVSTLQVAAGAGYTRGPVPFYEQFYIGGYSFSEIAARPFPGLRRDEEVARQMAIAGASYRRRLFSRPLGFVKRGFLNGIYNFGGFSSSQESPYYFESVHAGGMGLSLDTVLGRVDATGGWAEGGRFHFYLSLGPAF
jgi:NTE family protein